MPKPGWKRLAAGTSWFPRRAIPDSRLFRVHAAAAAGPRNPTAQASPAGFDPADPWGWPVTEYEEALELQPGLLHWPEQLLGALQHWGAASRPTASPAASCGAIPIGRSACIAGRARRTNATCCSAAGPLAHPGRQGPRALDALRRAASKGRAGLLAGLLRRRGASGPPSGPWTSSAGCSPPPMANRRSALADLRRAGLRIYSSPDICLAAVVERRSRCLPGPRPYRWQPGQSLRGVRYLLTFCPFGRCRPPCAGPIWRATSTCCRFRAAWCSSARRLICKLQKELPVADADSAVALAASARGAVGHPHSAVGLAARGGARRTAAARGLRPAARHLPPDAPLGPRPSPRG